MRNRYKIFIIDEVHQLSKSSFNALLKSIEEPPPHVVFMMATTELDKIPETVLSRAQVYEFRTIGTKAIAGQLRRIVDAEKITVPDEALQLIARDAEGSMRDAQSKLDQVIAFTGTTISVDDVGDGARARRSRLAAGRGAGRCGRRCGGGLCLAARAVEMGYDLRAVCRELTRVVRDLLVISVDGTRIHDAEIAGEHERDRLKALAARFSREDLLRAFDVLTKAEAELRTAAQPRYSLEMALLRWIYLRKLTPIADLLSGAPPAASRAPDRQSAPSSARRCASIRAETGQRAPRPISGRPTQPIDRTRLICSVGRAALCLRRRKREGRVSRRDPETESRLLSDGCRAGAEDRCVERDDYVFIFAGAKNLA